MKLVCALALFGLVVVACQGRSRNFDEKTSMALLARRFNPRIETGLQLKIYEKMVKANMNDYVDRMLKNAAQFMMDHGYEPMELPDISQPFSFKDLIGIEWHGELDMSHGWLQDLSTIYRSGDVTVEYQDEKMVIKAEMAFKDLVIDYDFVAKFMKLSKKGEADGKSTGVKVAFAAMVDIAAKKIELQDFSIIHVSDTTVEFEGLGTVGDFVVDAMSKVALQFFEDQIRSVVEKEARVVIEDALANTDIGDIIGSLARI
ncbi:uncharacterized protein [Hetaerina americana]|uniref:uncharacterized protein n=1 Tax=Hetaerina americana TaxID=62018 RepID=UPI003A7F4FEA